MQTTRPEVEVRRSTRRRRTVSAYREGERIVVLLPARMSRAEESSWVDRMVARVERAEKRRRPGDEELQTRAEALNQRYFGGLASPAAVRWVENQRSRWGSCTPADRTIRLSSRLQGMPTWVVDYVLVHELAHLLESHHDETFWSWVNRYPHTERAKGYLEGFSAASSIDAPPGADVD